MQRKTKIITSIVFFLLMTFQISWATPQTDSLITKLNSSVGEEKIKILIKLYIKTIYQNPELAREYGEESLKLSLEKKLDSYVAYSYLYVGMSYYFTNQWRISNEYYLKALQTNFSSKNSQIKASLLNNIGLNSKFLGEYEKSLKYIFDALKIFESEKDSINIAFARGNIGVLYLKLENPDEGIKHFNFALPILVELKDSISIANNYENISDAYFEKGELKNGEKYFSLAEIMMLKVGDTLGIARLYYEYGENLFSTSQYKEAINYFNKSLTYCDSSVTPNQYYLSIEGKAKASLYSGKTIEAERLLKIAKNGFANLEAIESAWINHLDLAKLYSKTGNWDKFNKHYNLYEQKRRTYLREKEINTVSELNLIYETEKKNKQIEFQQVEIKNKNNRIILISVIAVLISFGLFITLFLSRKLKFANRNLIEKNLELSERWKQLQKFYGSAESDFSSSSQNDLFRKIYRYMVDEQAYTNSSITVDYLSKKLSSNTKYISKAIKEETGMNFNTFINTFRIEEAKKLLRDKISSTWSLDAVAEQSGFNNTTSFFQAFKKNTGLTPSAFRNALLTSIVE